LARAQLGAGRPVSRWPSAKTLLSTDRDGRACCQIRNRRPFRVETACAGNFAKAGAGMNAVDLVAVLCGPLAWLAIRAVARDPGGLAVRLARSDVEATIASMPAELRDDWGEEWRAEFGAITDGAPTRAMFFALGLRRAARRLCDESGLNRPRRRPHRCSSIPKDDPLRRREAARNPPPTGSQARPARGEPRYGSIPPLPS
jgi:hypothetical protein